MNGHFTYPLIIGTRDYPADPAAMKRTAARVRKASIYRMKLLLATGMNTKTGGLKKQFPWCSSRHRSP